MISVLGDHPHKPGKQPRSHRRAIARLVLEDFFPLLRYTPVGYASLQVGEQSAAEVALLNSFKPVDLFYICAQDVRAIALSQIENCRQPLENLNRIGPVEEASMAPTLRAAVFQSPTAQPLAKSALPDFAETTPRIFHAIDISSSRFRRDPAIPMLPWKAFEYIHSHGLYLAEP